MIYILILVIVAGIALSFKKIGPSERGVIYRLGRKLEGSRGAGITFIIPLIDRIERISLDPFSVSLPPQSAITKDEIPIQLQASLDAVVKNAELAALKARDWRIHIMSQLQELMKDRLEDLDFDNLDSDFPDWVQSIRQELTRRAGEIGVEITGMQISNLSPRTRPEG